MGIYEHKPCAHYFWFIQILYPTVKDDPPNPADIDSSLIAYTVGFDVVFVSLNRYTSTNTR